MDKLQTLKYYFGHDGFRALQEDVIDAILEGRDSLMVLPTGGGKSLCYQLPTMLMDGVTVVVSPLLALMHDQVTSLKASGIPAAMISSMQTSEENKEVSTLLRDGKIKLLYVAPERLNAPGFAEMLSSLHINFVVIDEAHCVSEWGHEFREDYRKLTWIKQKWPDLTIAAFTATATPEVESDISVQLGLREPAMVRGRLYRPNLTIRVQHRIKDGKAQLLEFLRNHQDESGIIYTLSRKSTETLADYLRSRGIMAAAYHAGLEANIRNEIYTDFVADKIEIVVATIAFGMGIDKSNIRFVVHMQLPKSIEGYYQEIGRAGRDGLPAETMMLFEAADMIQQKNFIDNLPNTTYRDNLLSKLDAVYRLAQGENCRHQALARYFGDEMEPCATSCDNCTTPAAAKITITTPARQLLSSIWRTKQSFGLHYVVDVLRGSRDARVLSNKHDRLSVYGIGEEYSKAQWLTIGDRLLEEGALQIGEYRVYKLTPKGVEILKGQREVTINATRLEKTKVKKTGKSTMLHALSGDIRERFEHLRELRSEIATSDGVPPYVVFSDKTLIELSTKVPQTRQEMLDIHGIGEIKFEKYGELFLSALALEHP